MKKILFVIDAQRGFIQNQTTNEVLARIERLLAAGLFDCVLASVYQNNESSPMSCLMGWHKMLDKKEQELAGKIEPCIDHAILKSCYSAVTPESLARLKSENGGELPKAVFLAGFDTECCVLATAIDLFEQGIRPIVLADYCGSSGGKEQQEAGLKSLFSLIGRNHFYYGGVTEASDLDRALQNAEDLIDSSPAYQNEQTVLDLLVKKGWHITFAESCTGGLAAARLVDLPSASQVFNGSFVTYANEAKIAQLGVSPSTVNRFGVVSEPVAEEMARGAAKAAKAQVAVGISGIAGPTGGTEEKPVGTVCFGFFCNGSVKTATCRFGDIGRQNVRESSVDFVFKSLAEWLS